MNGWNIAIAIVMAGLFWLNALVLASPYVNQLVQRQAMSFSQAVAIGVATLLLCVVLFFVQVGSFAMGGLSGMVDPLFLEVIWTGPARDFIAGQFILVLFWMFYARSKTPLLRGVFWGVAFTAMMASYNAFGHAGTAGIWQKLFIALHIVLAFLWFGSLPALRKSCQHAPPAQLKLIMLRFGRHMSVAVPVLLILGVVVFRGLTGTWIPQLPFNDYALVLFIKLLIVAATLTPAAVHKLWLVPHLNDARSAQQLRRSISVEIVFASLVFLLAAALSTSFSP